MEPYGYLVQAGYIGHIDGKKILFPTEEEYRERVREINEKEESNALSDNAKQNS